MSRNKKQKEGVTFGMTREIILSELEQVLSRVEDDAVCEFINLILKAKKVFVMGVGRVMLMSQAFAKRLGHLRINSFVVGETTMPSIGKGDLLIVASGSGETLTCANVARLAKKHGAEIALVTARKDSTIKRLSRFAIRIPSPTKVDVTPEIISRQPMTNLFEQSLLLFYDAVSIMIQNKKGITEKDLWKLHANLE